jgi:hypothetical protein
VLVKFLKREEYKGEMYRYTRDNFTHKRENSNYDYEQEYFDPNILANDDSKKIKELCAKLDDRDNLNREIIEDIITLCRECLQDRPQDNIDLSRNSDGYQYNVKDKNFVYIYGCQVPTTKYYTQYMKDNPIYYKSDKKYSKLLTMLYGIGIVFSVTISIVSMLL